MPSKEELKKRGLSPEKIITNTQILCHHYDIKSLNEIEVANPEVIEQIVLSDCGLLDMQGFERFPDVKHLNLSFNDITKIDNLSNLKQLQKLEMQNNPISKIENMNELQSLRVLRLDECNIGKLEGFDDSDLSVLSVTNNQIQKIENIEHMVNLSVLNLDGNKISKIEGLDQLVKLARITLWGNPITEIEGLAFLSSLDTIHCDAIPDLEDVMFSDFEIQGLPALVRFISMVKIDNYFDVPDIAEVLRRAPDGFSMLKGEHFEGDLIDDKPRPGQEPVPFDYEDWFFKQAGPRLTKFLSAVRKKHKCQTAMTENSPTWRYILKRSKEFNNN